MQPPATCQKSWGILGRSCAWVVVQREKNLTAILDRAGITCRGARGHGGTRACPAPASAESRESRQRHSRVAAPAVQHIEIDIYLYSRALFRV